MAEEALDSEERSEPATPRRREEARERGHIARSTDLNGALVLLAALVALHFFGMNYFGALATLAKAAFGGLAHAEVSAETLPNRAALLVVLLVRALAPLLAAVVLVALAANWIQVGFIFTGEPLVPSWSKIDPIAGFRRLFSARSAVRLLGGFLKLAVIGFVLWITLKGQLGTLLALPSMTVPKIASTIADIGFAMGLRAAIALLVLGILDFAFQRWQYERDIRMSRQEVKEELKRLEGNPRIRERRRAIQRQLAQQRMMAAVPKAAVVVTNPDHVAVALSYEEEMGAPKVVAKGADYLAERIREIAHEHGVPIVQNPPLARAMYKQVEVGKEIPPKLYEAVAEILAYVFSLKKAA